MDDFWVSAENSRNSRVRCERLGCCMLCPPGAGDWYGSTSPGLTEGVWGPERRSGGSRSSRQSHPGSLQKTAETAESAARGSFRRVFWLLSACDRLEDASLTFWGYGQRNGGTKGEFGWSGWLRGGISGLLQKQQKTAECAAEIWNSESGAARSGFRCGQERIQVRTGAE